jgi:hypothetical protein
MSLYSLEEICEGCIHATFHDCCNSFCRCGIKVSDDVNGYNGTCKKKEKK